MNKLSYLQGYMAKRAGFWQSIGDALKAKQLRGGINAVTDMSKNVPGAAAAKKGITAAEFEGLSKMEQIQLMRETAPEDIAKHMNILPEEFEAMRGKALGDVLKGGLKTTVAYGAPTTVASGYLAS